MSIAVLLVTFALLFTMGVPIAFSLGLATLATMLMTMGFDPAVTTIAQRMAGGIDSFSLLAIPLFVLSGQLMAQGGIARRVVAFSKALIGAVPGGLAFVNVISCMIFGAISGSAVAATSAIGGFMIPEMNKAGYDKNFNAAVTATASTTGLLIPPSNILIIYAVASGGVSIAALFVAGYLPGLLVGLALMLVCGIYAKRNNFPAGERVSLGVVARTAVAAFPSLFLIVLVIGGIIAGIFTATEAGAIAVLYAWVLSMFIYREIDLADLHALVLKSVETTAIVMFLIATSMAMSWILAYENIPALVANAMVTISDNPIIILLLINVVLLLVGIFMDMTPAVLIFTPIFLPVAVELGMSPLHFGIMMVLNLCIGLCTPPVGGILFVGCAIAKTSIGQIVRPMIPMFLAMFLALMMVAYVPAISEALPRFFGLID
ncbi:TRAP transporter large permease subunit [Marinihelvus fidelis]|uniref:TRAP transporter large permease protein n=1 Tax=Marinihelvus fidelis TaxID=2613842 RepID=A0A5N0TI07_9GAMM|nr:TRAP transporter large permease subunit [Marinihelvus fidelis]KAA9134118.1 TRAP transporter large permease subunit [Marinihelvus fidelis]